MTTPGPPNIFVQPRSQDGALEYRWNPPTSDGGSPITGYELQLNADPPINLDAGARYTKVTGLDNGTLYSTTIRAQNAIGYGPTASFRPFQPGTKPTSAPSTATVSLQGATNAVVSWTPPPITPSSPIYWYVIESVSNNPADPVLRFTADGQQQTSYYVTGLNPVSQYYFRVSAVNFPGYSPYASTNLTASFSPSSVAGLNLWLNAADTASLSLTGNTVTSWRDRSSNAYLGTAVNGPTLSTNAIGANGVVAFNAASSQYINFGDVCDLGLNGLTVLAVAFLNSTGNIISKDIQGSAAGTYTLLGDTNQTFVSQDPTGGSADLVLSTPIRSTLLVEYTWNRTYNHSIYLFGSTVRTSTVANLTTTYNTGNSLFVGALQNATGTAPAAGYYLNGYIGEILLYNSSISAYNRHAAEGYLAWKWGLQSNLPPQHPFYSQSPPAQPASFSPAQITGMQTWLDGADPTGTGTTPADGASVTRWIDKSLSGTSATASTIAATYNAAESSLFFSSSVAAYTTPLNASGFNETLFIVYKLNTSTSVAAIDSLPSQGRYLTTRTGTMDLDTGRTNDLDLAWTATNTVRVATTQIGTLYMKDGNMRPMINGGTSSMTTYNAPMSAGRTSRILATNAFVKEVISYDRSLSDYDRQCVEGYLAWKWGIRSSLPSTHLFFSAPPGFQSTLRVGRVFGEANENNTLTMSTPAGQLFSDVLFASYGTPTGSAGVYQLASCHASNSWPLVSAAAIGRSSFSIAASNVPFGDPCSGTVKRLYVLMEYRL